MKGNRKSVAEIDRLLFPGAQLFILIPLYFFQETPNLSSVSRGSALYPDSPLFFSGNSESFRGGSRVFAAHYSFYEFTPTVCGQRTVHTVRPPSSGYLYLLSCSSTCFLMDLYLSSFPRSASTFAAGALFTKFGLFSIPSALAISRSIFALSALSL